MVLFLIQSKESSIFGGNANDFITVTGGTNINTAATSADVSHSTLVGAATSYAFATNTAFTGKAVTVRGGYGNDRIDASEDKAAINDGHSTEVRAGHVYEFDQFDGRDTIVGFNENDTIRLLGTFNAASDIRTAFDATGKYFVFTYVGTQIYIDVTQDYFKGGKTLNIVNENGGAVDGIADGYLTKVWLDADGNVTTVEADKKSWKYIVPKKLMGTAGSDTRTINNNQLRNIDDNFIVDALNGNDEIVNVGASYVSIDGNLGNDTIWLTSTVKSTGDTDEPYETVYGNNVTVHGGYGNDEIFDAYVTLASGDDSMIISTPDGTVHAEIDEDRKESRIYQFGWLDGHDTIHFFGQYDSISLDNSNGTTEFIGSSVSGTDLILQFGPDQYRTTSSITLKDFVSGNSGHDKSFWIAGEARTCLQTNSTKKAHCGNR